MINPETLNFLKLLSENNVREWFVEHKEEYDSARQNILQFTEQVISELAKLDQTIPADLEAKNCVMRIYRDVRFSKNKLPYKTNFGIAISANGKNFNGPGYYLHIQPGKSFIAGGSWMPEATHLKAIRQEIDYNGSDFREIVENKEFKKHFGSLDQSDALKTTPKGYESSHPEIEFLKLKSFIAERALTDAQLTKKDAATQAAASFEKLIPLMNFLRNAIS